MQKDYLKQFVIPFTGLKLGEYEYSFKITDVFFEFFSFNDINGANINVELLLEKQSTMMIFYFSLKGSIKTYCDRCSDPLEMKVSSEEKLIVKFSEEDSDNEEIVSISNSEYEFDVSKYLYEYVILAIPMKKTHEEEDCNQDVLDYLNGEYVEDIEDSEQEIDPRWEALNKIKNKN